MKERTQSMHWFRWHHGTVTDSKWRVVAARARHATSRHVTVSDVISVWGVMLECASQASPRGTLVGWNDEDVAALLELDEPIVAAIIQAMQGKTLEGNRLISWEKRQPKREREDPTATVRQTRKRARDAAANGVTVRDNEASRHETPRGEERREEEILHSVGEGNTSTSRDLAPAAVDPAPDSEATKASASRAGAIGRALVDAGLPATRVNQHTPLFRQIAESDISPEEVGAAARELIARGKTDVTYILRTVIGRRADASAAAPIPAKPAAPRSPYKPYVPPPPASPEEAFLVEQAQYAQMLADGLIDQANHDRMLAEAKDRRARAGPVKSTPPKAPSPTTAQATA